MESTLERELDQLMDERDVVGVICADNDGLCLGVRGKANASAAGWIHALATSASGLQNAISSTDRDHTEEDEDGTAAAEEEEKITHAGGLRRITPTVKVAVDGINVLIQHYGEVTIAIFKAETFE